MKDYRTRYDELHKCYQTWLTDFTRLAVQHGMCHQNIYYTHDLTVGCLRFPGKEPAIAIVPQFLNWIIYDDNENAPASLSLEDDLSVSLCPQYHLLVQHPMLEGILLSECVRLKQYSLANKLTSLFQQFSGNELRLKFVWLCWYDLMLGNSMDDWTESLKLKSEEEVNRWINERQAVSPALTRMMDKYVLSSYRTTVGY